MSEQGWQELDRAYAVLEQQVPGRVARTIQWLRDPASRRDRLPLGLLLIAEDAPFLHRPAGRMMLWLECKWVALRRWWQARRS